MRSRSCDKGRTRRWVDDELPHRFFPNSIGATAGGSRCPSNSGTASWPRWRPAGRRRSTRSAADTCQTERADSICPVRFLKVSKDKKNPLIVALQAWAALKTRWCVKTSALWNWRKKADTSSSRRWAITAEAGTAFRPARKAVTAPVAVAAADARCNSGACRRRPRPALPSRCKAGGALQRGGRRTGGRRRERVVEPRSPITAKVRELSEKDVMNVLKMIRKEFNVDERRTYLMGHSMGGAGTFYLASKYPQIWAAVAAIAPPGAGGASGGDQLGTQFPRLSFRGTRTPRFPWPARAGSSTDSRRRTRSTSILKSPAPVTTSPEYRRFTSSSRSTPSRLGAKLPTVPCSRTPARTRSMT